MTHLFQQTQHRFAALIGMALACILPGLLSAGGYLLVSKSGVVYRWDTSKPIPQDLDGGDFGLLTGAAATSFVKDAILVWSDEPTLALSFSFGSSPLVADGDVNTLSEFLAVSVAGNGKSPVIMDDDGAILTALGVPPGVVGMTFIKKQDDLKHEIVETMQIYNGQLIDGNPANGELSLQEMARAISHEMGHALNFDHTQVNGHYFIGDVDDPGFQKYGAPPAGAGVVNLMFPFAISGDNIADTPNRDDLSTAEFLYGNSSALSGQISGQVFAADGSTPIQGANVIARNAADPFFDAVSSVSGYRYWPSGPGSGVAPAALKGQYELRGLTPGTQYTVEKVRVHTTFRHGSSVGPLEVPMYFDIEEFYNGSDESSDGARDKPASFVAVQASATGIDFIANVIAGKLALGDDTVLEVPLPFAFPFYGQDYRSVFVHANGFLTFGAPSDEAFLGAFESIVDLLSSPPRIAPLWDDLNPSSAGTVTALPDGAEFVIAFNEVPEYAPAFGAGGANSFSIRLRPDGAFKIQYGSLSAQDGLAGVSIGERATDPGEADLSRLLQPIRPAKPGDAIYQLFDPLLRTANDLTQTSLEFAPLTDSAPPEIAPAAAGICYAATASGYLLSFSHASATSITIGATGFANLTDLAIDSAGRIFGVAVSAGRSYLLRISATTGYAESVAEITASTVLLGAIEAIAFNENDELYGIDQHNTLLKIDINDGTAAIIGATGVSATGSGLFGGLAFQPGNGNLFAVLKSGDAVYQIDPATGQATLLGQTGLGLGNDALQFINDDLFASTVRQGASSQLIRIDLNSVAASVVGDFGFPAAQGLACFGDHSSAISDYVLLSDGDIKIAGNAVSEGKIHSNQAIHFERGLPGVHTGDLSAVSRITIDADNNILGAVTTGGSLFLHESVTIGGTTTEQASVAEIALQQATFSAGRSDQTVPRKARFELSPGHYGKVKVEKYGELILKSGRYFVRELDTDRFAKLIFDVSAGPVHVYATNELEFDDGTVVDIVPLGENGTRFVSFTTLQSHKVDVGKSAVVLGSINAPKAKVLLSKGSVFKGAISAKSINIQQAVPFFHHDASQALPKPAALPDEPEQSILLIADQFLLEQNYPNPFNPETTIRYQLSEASEVEMIVFDQLGREIANLVRANQPAGFYTIRWDGRDGNGNKVATGMYWYRLRAGGFVQTRQMLMTK